MDQATREMPKYKCYKEVHALKIADIRPEKDGGVTIVPEDEGYGPFLVDKDYVSKHAPQPGGYFVVYKDGYKSFSPADAFEEGYTRMEQ